MEHLTVVLIEDNGYPRKTGQLEDSHRDLKCRKARPRWLRIQKPEALMLQSVPPYVDTQDNPDDVDLFRDMLTHSPIDVETSDVAVDVVYADRLAVGLDCLRDGNIDVVLLDLSLPDCQKLDTLVGRDHVGCEVPVVVMTGLEDTAFGLKVMQHGAQDDLIKRQIKPGTLIQSLRYAIERQQSHCTLQAREVRFHPLLVGGADGTIVLDDDGMIRCVNPAAAALFGREHRDVLTAIIGYNNILVKHLDKEKVLHHHASQISLVANRAALLTRQLLACSRQETPQPEVLDCNQVVRNTETILHSLIGTQAALVCQLGISIWRIRCDPYSCNNCSSIWW